MTKMKMNFLQYGPFENYKSEGEMTFVGDIFQIYTSWRGSVTSAKVDYIVNGKKNEVGGYEGEDLNNRVYVAWAQTTPGVYHGLWVEGGEEFLFQMETL